LRGDAGRVGGAAKRLEPQGCKQAGANSDQAQGFDPGRMAVVLPLETDGDREDRGYEKTKGEVGVAFECQGYLSLFRDGRRAGPWSRVRR
jgi:hypothetical protein